MPLYTSVEVWHKGLLFKLRQNGIEGKLLEWLNSYLSQRKQKVGLKSCFSCLKSIFAGVPQGSVLGPLLFLVYINDIAKHLLSLTRLFADDSSLFYSAAHIDDIAGIINHDLQLLTNWAKQWLVTFNPLKTEAVLFTLKKLDFLPQLVFKARDFNATSLSTYDFSTLYTTLPHNLIKDKLIDLIERTFQREGSPYLACSDRNAFFTSEKPKKYHAWSCQNVCDALTFLLDNIFIRFGTKLYRQVVGIPMGTNCAPLVADLFLFCYERDFMMSLSDDKQADVIDALNTTSRYLDDILNINNVYFENMVSQIYPSELQLNKANASDTEAAFLDLHLSISNDIVSTKIYDKRDDFDFEIVNFPFLDGDVPRSTSYGVYISQLIRFARASSYVTDFNTRNKLLTQKLLKQGYQYHKLRKTFSKF